MQTKLTNLLGIKYPILQGGMAWTSDAVLAAAVSNAGGAGIIGSGGRTVEWTREEIRKAKQLTDKPFGVNVMLMAPNVAEIIAMLCEEKVAFVTLGAGNPVPFIKKFQEAGIKVIPVVPNVKLAMRIEAAGADALVVEGMEAGGHIGKQTTMALMENVLPNIKNIPVLVAGGISDGRALAAALLMGAEGVQMGSRFLLTTECPAHSAAKAAIIKATDTDSVATGYSRNLGVRCLANAFTDAYTAKEIAGAPNEELMAMGTGTNRLGILEGDTEKGTVMVGQSLNVLNDVLPCKEVMERIIAEAKAAIARVKNIEL
ncbi:nitronate monooxygenase [uncultured Phascolarctobacterium sp.]|uniref:nitronate monooxygenase n=1 Tax=uncultured Phascolarctobacterium sp. TaxID=512296 RepID=UPI00262903D2|nr:nitronate monooxygenase [uncultured Phascolarctobacterium sp.]